MDAPSRSVTYLDIHAGDVPTPAGGMTAAHPMAGDLTELTGRDGPRCYEVERVDHDFPGGRHVVRVFVEQVGPLRQFTARPGESQAGRGHAAPDPRAAARLIV